MKCVFDYYHHQDDQSDEGYMRPTFALPDKQYLEMSKEEARERELRGDFDFYWFIFSLDKENSQRVYDCISKFLNNTISLEDYIICCNGCAANIKVRADITEFNLSILETDVYQGAIDTSFFLRLLKAWNDYIHSGIQEEVIVEI